MEKILQYLETCPERCDRLSAISEAVEKDYYAVEDACDELCRYGSVSHTNDIIGESIYILEEDR